MENKIEKSKKGVFWYANNKSQINLMYVSLLSFYKVNLKSEIKTLIMLDERIFDSYKLEISKFLSEHGIKNYEIFSNKLIPNYEGMIVHFNWYFIAFLADVDYILKLDNDIFVNTTYDQYIEIAEASSKIIFGVRTSFDYDIRRRKGMEYFLGRDTFSKFEDKYINGGVIFFKREKLLDKIGDIYAFREEIENILTVSRKNKFLIHDQEFNIIKFREDIETINGKFNVRIHSISTAKNHLTDNHDFNLHFNLWFKKDNKNEKFDVEKFIYNKEEDSSKIEEMYKIWVESIEKNGKQLKKIQKDDLKSVVFLTKMIYTNILIDLKNMDRKIRENDKWACQVYGQRTTTKQNVNIGDNIQTISYLRILGLNWKDLVWIDREDFKTPPIRQKEKNPNVFIDKKSKYKIIWNGWHGPCGEKKKVKYKKMSEKLIPFFTSFHLQKSTPITGGFKKILKRYEPIGCRDIDTFNYLKNNDIDSYFSGCVTLTLKSSKDKVIRNKGNRKIIFILDNYGIRNENDFRKWKLKDKLKQALLSYGYTESELQSPSFYQQVYRRKANQEYYFNLAEERLKIIEDADLVVTTRIHSLMPAIALGTPALLLTNNVNDTRFKGLIDFWNFIDINDQFSVESLNNNVKFGDNGIFNDNSFKLLAEKMEDSILKFSLAEE